jgi:hypothetical protein
VGLDAGRSVGFRYWLLVLEAIGRFRDVFSSLTPAASSLLLLVLVVAGAIGIHVPYLLAVFTVPALIARNALVPLAVLVGIGVVVLRLGSPAAQQGGNAQKSYSEKAFHGVWASQLWYTLLSFWLDGTDSSQAKARPSGHVVALGPIGGHGVFPSTWPDEDWARGGR